MRTSEYDYNNSTMRERIDARQAARAARRAAAAETDVIKANALLSLANKPASGSNKALIIIPAAVILLGGVVAIIMLKKKK